MRKSVAVCGAVAVLAILVAGNLMSQPPRPLPQAPLPPNELDDDAPIPPAPVPVAPPFPAPLSADLGNGASFPVPHPDFYTKVDKDGGGVTSFFPSLPKFAVVMNDRSKNVPRLRWFHHQLRVKTGNEIKNKVAIESEVELQRALARYLSEVVLNNAICELDQISKEFPDTPASLKAKLALKAIWLGEDVGAEDNEDGREEAISDEPAVPEQR